MTMLTRPRTWAALAVTVSLIAVLSTGTASAVPSTLPPLLKIKSGTANLCLDPAAHTALDTAEVGMSTGAPAQLVSTATEPCATHHVTDGAITLGLIDGSVALPGTITFTRATDQAALTFSDITVTFGQRPAQPPAANRPKPFATGPNATATRYLTLPPFAGHDRLHPGWHRTPNDQRPMGS
jgi:hypothetical protein